MPELPDLTVFAENLHRRFKGKTVKDLDCRISGRLNVAAEALSDAVVGTVLERVDRSGKEIEFTFSSGTRLRIHLMLSGRFVVSDAPERPSGALLTIRFEEGPALAVTDPKGLVSAALDPEPGSAPDALEADGAYLLRRAAKKPRTAAKAFLIDQGVLRGIGNAYADEILWEARISPKAAVWQIPAEVMDDLAAAIRRVLEEAIEKIRASNPGITGGEIRDFLLIHNPHRTQSPTGRPIVKEKIASKTTYYTDEQISY